MFYKTFFNLPGDILPSFPRSAHRYSSPQACCASSHPGPPFYRTLGKDSQVMGSTAADSQAEGLSAGKKLEEEVTQIVVAQQMYKDVISDFKSQDPTPWNCHH